MTAMPREWAFLFFAQVGQALGKPVHTRFPVNSGRKGLNSGLMGPTALKNVKGLKKVVAVV